MEKTPFLVIEVLSNEPIYQAINVRHYFSIE